MDGFAKWLIISRVQTLAFFRISDGNKNVFKFAKYGGVIVKKNTSIIFFWRLTEMKIIYRLQIYSAISLMAYRPGGLHHIPYYYAEPYRLFYLVGAMYQ